jgi:hypothetical protein
LEITMLKRTMLASALLAFAGAMPLTTIANAAPLSLSSGLVNISAKSETRAHKPRKHKASRRAKSGVTFSDGSAENRSERDRRLMRECKGRPNSGACEGYTR